MNTPVLPRLGAACGVIFAVVLFVAAGDGTQAFSIPREIAGLAALALAIPFIAYIGSLLRAAEGPGGWLALTALGSGIAGMTIKLGSDAPVLAAHRSHLADGTQIHGVLQQFADSATVLSLYPLAIFCASTAIVAFRTRVLPRWLAALTAVTAVALAVNAGFLSTDLVIGMLVLTLWSVVTGVYLLIKARSVTFPVPEPVSA